jgi:molybdopterin-guanine dinucleotide biosynthesis protein A
MCHSGLGCSDVAGVILAGGRSQRMGSRDKALLPLAGRPMITHVIERLRGQAAALVVNTSNLEAGFEPFGLPLAADLHDKYAGPLAGMLAGMRWAQEYCPAARWIATAACDTPFLPGNYVAALRQAAARESAAIAIAASAGRLHPVLGLWKMTLADDLAAQLAGGARKVRLWAERHAHVIVDFPVEAAGDPFFNVNTPEDFALAGQLLGGEGA